MTTVTKRSVEISNIESDSNKNAYSMSINSPSSIGLPNFLKFDLTNFKANIPYMIWFVISIGSIVESYKKCVDINHKVILMILSLLPIINIIILVGIWNKYLCGNRSHVNIPRNRTNSNKPTPNYNKPPPNSNKLSPNYNKNSVNRNGMGKQYLNSGNIYPIKINRPLV